MCEESTFFRTCLNIKLVNRVGPEPLRRLVVTATAQDLEITGEQRKLVMWTNLVL